MTERRTELEELARLYDVELAYHDIKGQHFVATDEALLALLPQLGAAVETLEDVPAALAARRRALATRTLEPVVVVWEDDTLEASLQLPEDACAGPVVASVSLESGRRFEHRQDAATLETIATTSVDGRTYRRLRLGLGRSVPHGYHTLTVEHAGATYSARVIAAPRRAWRPAAPRQWGLFCPAYALRSEGDLGLGGLAELERLVDFTRELGGAVVGTLPLTATFLRELASPSPYGPVSRLFWNELYLDLERLPELAECAAARARLDAAGDEIAALRARPQAEHVQAMAVLRRVLEPLAAHAFERGSKRRQEMLTRLEAAPRLAEYARFRATIEARGEAWHAWPTELVEVAVTEDDYDRAAFEYHAYVQIRMADQLEALSARAQAAGGGLYLDLPLGVHPDGYDAWRFKDEFLPGCSAGAPPDDLFAGGQNWGFRPLHPHAIRDNGYDYVIACMQQQFALAGAMRVDHVMGLHRLFCIPHGMSGDKGVYVKYRAEELYAILCLESHRNQCFVIGEDLGTVPPEVRAAMDRHELMRMYVLQFSVDTERARAVQWPCAQVVASINTHDTPTFAAFWQGQDIDLRVRLGHTSEAEARTERAWRDEMKGAVKAFLRDQHMMGEPEGTADVLGAALNLIASSDAPLVLVNLEDLWGEAHAQNVPGTVHEHPNWQNRCRYPLEALPEVPGLLDTLREIQRRRTR